MPRPPQYDRDEVIQAITAARDRILNDKKIAGPTDPVWSELSEQLRGCETKTPHNREIK